MNIVYVSTDFGVPIFGYKGASRHVREVVAAFDQAGHAVWLLSPAMVEQAGNEQGSNFGDDVETQVATVGELPASFREALGSASFDKVRFVTVAPAARHLGIVNELVGLDGVLGRRTALRQDLRSILYNVAFGEQAAVHLRSERIDFVYERYAAFSYAGIDLARALGVPHVLEVNAPLAVEHQKRRGLELKDLARDAEGRIFLETDHVIVVSAELRDVVASYGVPVSRVSVLPNAVDPERFSPRRAADGREVRARYQLTGTRVIGFVGSLKPWHGTDTLIDAFQRLHAGAPHTRLLIVGDGPERRALEERVERYGIRGAVAFTGNVSPKDVPDCIAAMDIAVAPYMPSDTFYYSPLKVFEYMSMARPVVAGNIGQVRELLADGETGVLFDPGDIEQLTRALSDLVDRPELCQRIGEKARAVILKEHSWAQTAGRLVALASGLIDQVRTSPAARWPRPDAHAASGGARRHGA